MSAFCINCGTELPEEAGFCPKCGTKVEVPRCPSCGKEVDFGADFCIYCGTAIKIDTQSTKLEKPLPQSVEPKSEVETSISNGAQSGQASQATNQKKSAPGWAKLRFITALLGIVIVGVYWLVTSVPWATKQGPSEMWTNAMHVQSENHIQEYLIQNGISDAIEVDINQDDVTYEINSVAWEDIDKLEGMFAESPTPYLNKGKKAYWYQYTAPFVVILDGTEIGRGTIRPDVVWNPQKGLTPQEIQSTGYREFADFDLSPELIAAVEAASHITPDDLIGRWELRYLETDGVIFTPDTLSEQGYSDDVIDAYFSATFIQFFDDNSFEMFSLDESSNPISTNGAWRIQNNKISISEPGSEVVSTGTINDEMLCFEEDNITMRFERVSLVPSSPTSSGSEVPVNDVLAEYIGTWFASRWDENTGFAVGSDDPYSIGFDGIQLELYELSGKYYASLYRTESMWSRNYTYKNDTILPVEQIDEGTFYILFDCGETGWPAYPDEVVYPGQLTLTINPAGKLFGEMRGGTDAVFSQMPLSNIREWRGGRYIDYDTDKSAHAFSSDEIWSVANEEPPTILEMEEIFFRYVSGVWYSDDTTWDFTPYDIHITQGYYENLRGGAKFAFEFYGEWNPSHIYRLESNEFWDMAPEDVILYIDGEEFRRDTY